MITFFVVHSVQSI